MPSCYFSTATLRGRTLWKLSFQCHMFRRWVRLPANTTSPRWKHTLLDTGHFALETHDEDLASSIEKVFVQ
jgi:hypothetical protein